ncbi:epimerase [Loktanella agnita]|uniref:epimerase n=1 Tax=Loktanella agnita TaxID=287097 RepID=UPI003989DB1B
MRLLCVGGTGFLGGEVARAAVTAGHEVTVMTRSGQNVTAGAATLIADRDQSLPDLYGAFDTIIDTCGYAPDMVNRLIAAVGHVHYVFVSSISVYSDLSEPGQDETALAPTASDADLKFAYGTLPAHRTDATHYGPAYGPLKRACEETVIAALGDSATVIRLGLIVGPGDKTDRFTWWVRRCDQGGALPVPDPPDRSIQVIDIADVAAFILHLAERRIGGIFNTTAPPMTFAAMLSAIFAQTQQPADLRWGPLQAFTKAGLQPWSDLPLIVPDDPIVRHMLNVSTARAQEAGLTCRPLEDTIQRILSWDRGQRDAALKCGMSGVAEQAVLHVLTDPA